jgi:hypothetical protein
MPMASTLPNLAPMVLILIFAMAVPFAAFGGVLVIDLRRGKGNPRLLTVVAVLAFALFLLLYNLITWVWQGTDSFQ